MHTDIVFEHPLNEKMRTWLRMELLLTHLLAYKTVHDHASALAFFYNAASLLDVFDRGEVRADLLKDLERKERKLQAWAEVPGVDNHRITLLIQQIKHSVATLMSAPRIGQILREERLISLVRQRINIPGGCCSFDLPVLHIWLHLPQIQRDQQINYWLDSLLAVRQAIQLILELTRNSAIFRQQTSINGFYQDSSDDTDLLRLKLTLINELYPQISGHKNRFSIRFLPLDNEHGKVPERLDFELACC